MDPIPESYVEPLQWFSDYFQTKLKAESPEDANLVQKGLMLYRQGSVSKIKLERGFVIGTVQDVIPVDVKLDLNLPYLSECSCPREGLCRHEMAVFFRLLSHGGSVSAWIEKWRKPLLEKKESKDLGLMRAKDLLKSTVYAKPDYVQWTTSFRESFNTIMKGNGTPKPSLINELFAVYLRRLHAGAPFETEWKILYLLIGHIISFKCLLSLSEELKHEEDTIGRYYRHLFQHLLDEIEELSYKLSLQSFPFSFDDFIEKLKLESLQLLTIEVGVDYERIHLFRLLWTDLFKEKNWREAMKDALLAHPHPSLAMKIGTIHLALLLSHDEEALSLMEKCDEDLAPYFLYWLTIIPTKRMEPYVIVFISFIKNYLHEQHDYYACKQFVRMALKTIASFCHDHQRYDLFEKALMTMLPYSFHDYEHFLFEEKQYEKWMELQTYAGFQLELVSNDQIKILQKEAPSVLLPLYHQGIQHDLNGKNRTHYRQAVRKLKKLRTIYKKLKRQDEFNQYFDLLLRRTKRLRAFHEECRRGKLIDA